MASGVVDEPGAASQQRGARGRRRIGYQLDTEDSAAIARLARVTAELAAAETIDDIVVVVADHIRSAVDAAASTLFLKDGDALVMAGARGISAEKAGRWALHPMSRRTPLTDAVAQGQIVIAATPDVVRREYPLMASDTPASRSVVSLPLHVADEVVGGIGLTFENNRVPTAAECEFLMTFADACAQTLRRVSATQAADEAASQLRLLATASAELASSLDYRTTLNNVARICVPDFATWCAVHLLDQAGKLELLAVAHADPAKITWAWELDRRYPVEMDAPNGAPRVVRTGLSELVRDIPDELLVAGARDEEHLRISRELDVRSAIIVALQARGRRLGTLTLIRSTELGNFSDADLTVAEDLGRRGAVAIDNARLYDETVAVASELQSALLPARLTALEGWDTAGFYRPDGRVEVGGDFYDAVHLRDGRLAVFIGDVMGHGISAAATMAQVRASLRALATVDPHPATVFEHMDGLFEELAVEPLVSLVYAVVDPAGRVQLANAGHCPPIKVHPDGTTELLYQHGRPAFGTGRRAAEVVELDLEPGAVLLLYTDGLVERRGESLDTGFSRLCDAVAPLVAGPMEATLSRLAERVAGDNPQDDVAALALRRNVG